ncbi:hypothetical protein [Methylotenera versatilis]|uniref:hypothetical protein n=1 Tax=Methylotenera versatilis TaxID=1055487 RepID=UPI00064730D9|nr:hypothetical protein [Methylotenera versatilis]
MLKKYLNASKHLQRLVLTSFVVTFASARIIVLLIMTRDIPDLFLHIGGTHVHHLNYGIFLLSVVGAVLLFTTPSKKWLSVIAVTYGVGLALTFDEFGMWLHLGGSYWQRASFDAVTIIGGILLLATYTPPTHWTWRRFAGAALIVTVISVFCWRLSLTLPSIEQILIPILHNIENQGPH